MTATIRYAGLDVHKDSTVIAMAEASGGEAKVWGRVASDPIAVEHALAQLGGPSRVRACYEAGPTGYGLVRRLRAAGYTCDVVAPSLVPRDRRRVKTDYRDAVRLAHFLRSGDLTTVVVPDAATEAIRDLVRARDAAKRAERVVRHQLDKFLLRHARVWSGKTKWTQTYLAWVRTQRFEYSALTMTFEDALAAVEAAGERVGRLSAAIDEATAMWSGGPLVRAFQAFRGIHTVTAATLAAEIGDFARFTHPRQLMAYLGLVPSEHSSGLSRRQGPITRTGNGHVRRVLVEAAWSYRMRAQLSKAIAARNEGVAEGVRAIAWKAQKRLHKRYLRLILRGKSKQEVVVAVARELAGFLWAAARQPQYLATPS
jgi:transposase